MKQISLFIASLFLVAITANATTAKLESNAETIIYNNGYGKSFIFNEGGIEFSVFADGQFDFYMSRYGSNVNVSVSSPNLSASFNSGRDYNAYVQYDEFGAIIQIENTPIYYDYYGRIVQTFKMSEKVKVIQNKNKRSKIFKSILQDAFKQLHDAKDNIDLLKLIQESFKLCK